MRYKKPCPTGHGFLRYFHRGRRPRHTAGGNAALGPLAEGAVTSAHTGDWGSVLKTNETPSVNEGGKAPCGRSGRAMLATTLCIA